MIFDPKGFITPIITSGKILLREATPHGVDWDEPLPSSYLQKWTEWQSSLQSIKIVAIPWWWYHTIDGQGQLAPPRGQTVSRLKLCGAVLAEIHVISMQLDIPLDSMHNYTYSKVVLEYISNHTRRFNTYVSNRFDCILKIFSADRWKYVPTNKNPAVSCTRYITSVIDITQVSWIIGPKWLCNTNIRKHLCFRVFSTHWTCLWCGI